MMESMNDWKLDNLARFNRFYGPTVWCILVQGPVRSPRMVVTQIRRYNSPEMALVEDDDVVEEFPTKAANHPLHIGVCQGEAGAVTTSSMPRPSILRVTRSP